ncbi:Probable RNA-directed DNA polymerase from transposon BS [Eumeta japonica]|uniref:Probable RNA-directed DNA polymerase from transposon BS n=1 Tax=Eumeta variegata TaxID=151549 RepID=A0A4C1WV66_EUMVA|nr:Probable RNA-directed DNA polymerase from transposon BS [Eumeta japonica]
MFNNNAFHCYRIQNVIIPSPAYQRAASGMALAIAAGQEDPRNLSNLRPITLLSHVAKTFEHALLKRLSPFLSPRKEQYEFPTGHSTTLQLIRVLHYLASELNCGRYTVPVFLDMEKAFNRVWHDALQKLLKTQLSPISTKIIASFLCDRSFCVAAEEALSAPPRSIRAVVPQGSCLSPSLFAAFTDDVFTLQGQP